MKKVPTNSIITARKSLKESLSKDINSDNPTEEVLKRRKDKNKQRRKQLYEMEKKYDFSQNEKAITFTSWSLDKQKRRFKELHKLYIELQDNTLCEETNSAMNKNISEICHTIETQKMNASDMYNTIKALQYQVSIDVERRTESKRNKIKDRFNHLGGSALYGDLKRYLKDTGVNMNELY